MSVYLPNCQTGLGSYLVRSLQNQDDSEYVPFFQVTYVHAKGPDQYEIEMSCTLQKLNLHDIFLGATTTCTCDFLNDSL